MNNEQESRNQLIGEFMLIAGLSILFIVAYANFCGLFVEVWKGVR
jgi:hypothetical protein